MPRNHRRRPGPEPWVPPDLHEIENLAARGLTRAQIAGALGISTKTLHRRCEDSRQVDDAMRRGTAKGIAVIANKLFEAARSGNVAAMALFLKTRAGWRDAVAVDSDAPLTDPRDALRDVLARVRQLDAAATSDGTDGPNRRDP